MELKDATNINLLLNYIEEKQNVLNYYEEKIIRDLYIYYQEYQLFLLITNKGNNKNTCIEFIDSNKNKKIKIEISKNNFTNFGLSWFFKNATFLDEHYIIMKDYQIAYANHEKDFWINKEDEIVSWYLNEEIPRKWLPLYSDVWNPFPVNLNNYEYNLLYEDENIKLVNFISKLVLEEKNFKTMSLIHRGYLGKKERPCDIYRTNLRSVDYKYMNYRESINSISFNEFYIMQNYYKNQYTELKRNLTLKD